MVIMCLRIYTHSAPMLVGFAQNLQLKSLPIVIKNKKKNTVQGDMYNVTGVPFVFLTRDTREIFAQCI